MSPIPEHVGSGTQCRETRSTWGLASSVAYPGALGVWHPVSRSRHWRACPHVRLRPHVRPRRVTSHVRLRSHVRPRRVTSHVRLRSHVRLCLAATAFFPCSLPHMGTGTLVRASPHKLPDPMCFVRASPHKLPDPTCFDYFSFISLLTARITDILTPVSSLIFR